MNRGPHEAALRARWELEGQIPLAGTADGATWHRGRAVPGGEPVALLCVEGDAALETADAALRAFLVENPRLLPVADVQTFGEAGESPLTVVAYPFPPAPPFAALLSRSTLHPETARSVIGEAAAGLDAARRRGLRHLHLDSNRIFVDTAQGTVILLGVGVETAAHAGADPTGQEAAQRDVVSLVTLLHRAITGRTPRPGEDGRVPAPSTLASDGVPADLDDLCSRVLNGDESGPATVRELVEALGPWQSIPVTLEAYGTPGTERLAAFRDSVPAAPAVGPPTGAGPSATAGPAPELVAEPTQAMAPITEAPEPDADPAPTAAMPPVPGPETGSTAAPAIATADASSAASDAAHTPPPVAEPEPEPEDPASREARELVEELGLTTSRTPSAFPGDLALVPAPSRLPAPVEPEDDAAEPDLAEADDALLAGSSVPALPPREGGATATPNAAHAAEPVMERSAPVVVGGSSVVSEDGGPIIVPGRSAPLAPARQAAPEQSRASYLRDVVGVAMDHDDPSTFEMGPAEPAARSRQAQWILLGAALVVIVAVVIAITTITSPLRGSSGGPTSAASGSAAGTPAASAAPEGGAPAAPAPAPAGPPAIAGVTVQSERGSDHPEDAGRMTDGDAGTAWRSKIYKTEAFGGLEPGVGVVVDLAAPATVTAVVVTTSEAQGGSIELRAVNPDGSMGDPIASAPFAGDGEVRLQPGEPIQAQKVMLWIPQLPKDSKGFRAQIAEIRVE